MPMKRDARPPRLARWLLRLRPLGSRRAEVDADFQGAARVDPVFVLRQS